VLGAQVLRDVQTFVAALDTTFGGFRERADATYRLLQADGTAFVVVAAPERDALREASYFVERLAAERMPLAGLVLNRVQVTAAEGLSADRASTAAEDLEEAGEDELTAGLLRLHADRMRRRAAERALAPGSPARTPTCRWRGSGPPGGRPRPGRAARGGRGPVSRLTLAARRRLTPSGRSAEGTECEDRLSWDTPPHLREAWQARTGTACALGMIRRGRPERRDARSARSRVVRRPWAPVEGETARSRRRLGRHPTGWTTPSRRCAELGP
jgi:hypothetical protein